MIRLERKNAFHATAVEGRVGQLHTELTVRAKRAGGSTVNLLSKELT